MRCALEIQVVRQQDFAAPNAPIRPISSAIQCESDDASFEMIFGHATGDMRMMVLHADRPYSWLFPRPARREVIRMQVVGHNTWSNLEGSLEMLDSFLKKPVCLRVLQIADVLTEEEASRPRRRQIVFFSSPPTASVEGNSLFRNTGTGTKPRERRICRVRPPLRRSTESSHRRRISRSCNRNQSAMPPSLATASEFPIAIGSSLKLPLVIAERLEFAFSK